MVGKVRFIKIKTFPRPHVIKAMWDQTMEGASDSTILTLISHDEATAASAYNSHPEHTSFAQVQTPNCFPESEIDNVIMELEFTLTKGAIETDKVVTCRNAFMIINTAFLEDLTPKDELTSATPKTILELASESTDRQAYPLYSTIKMVESYSGSATMDATYAGLTTTQVLETVAFTENIYYNSIQFYTIAEKIKKLQRGLKWFTLTRQHPTKKFRIFVSGKSKFINPYTFMGVLTHTPQVSTAYQTAVAGETTAIPHVRVRAHIRYNEWNQNFDHDKV